MDDGITLRHERVDRLSGAGGTVAEFGRVDYLLGAILMFENVLQLLQERFGVVLAVFQDTDDLARDTGKLGTATPDLGEIFGAGVEDLNGTSLGNHTHVPPCTGLFYSPTLMEGRPIVQPGTDAQRCVLACSALLRHGLQAAGKVQPHPGTSHGQDVLDKPGDS